MQYRQAVKDCEGGDCEQPVKEKLFLLTTALQINTNPPKLPRNLSDYPYLEAWVGNQYLCQVTHNRKLTFCHSVWLQFQQEEDDGFGPVDRFLPYGLGPAGLELDDY